MSEVEIQELKQKLNANPPSVIFNYLKTLISMIINISPSGGNRSSESDRSIDKRIIKKYEKQLQTLESECRNHIRMEQQLKLIVEAMQQKTEELKKKNQKYKNLYEQTLIKLETEKKNNEKISKQMESKVLKENNISIIKTNLEKPSNETKIEKSQKIDNSSQKDNQRVKGKFNSLSNCNSSIFDTKHSLEKNQIKFANKKVSPSKIKHNIKENINSFLFAKNVSYDKIQSKQNNNDLGIQNQKRFSLHPSELKKVLLNKSKNSSMLSKKFSNIYKSMNISNAGSRKVSIKKSSSLLYKKSKSKSEINYIYSFPKKDSLNDIFNTYMDKSYFKSINKINKSAGRKSSINELKQISNRIYSRGKTFLTGKNTDSQQRKSRLNTFDYFKYKK